MAIKISSSLVDQLAGDLHQLEEEVEAHRGASRLMIEALAHCAVIARADPNNPMSKKILGAVDRAFPKRRKR